VSNLEVVRRIATGLPEVEEVSGERVSWRVRGKLFAWVARERDGGGLAVRVDREEKRLILEGGSDAYFTSPHCDGYPAVQIHLDRIDERELAERIEEAWLVQAPKRLAAEYLSATK
jgi:hypothetical protein